MVSGGLEMRSTDDDAPLPLSSTEILNLPTGQWRSSADFPVALSSTAVVMASSTLESSRESFTVTGGQLNGLEGAWSPGLFLFEQQPWVWRYLDDAQMKQERIHHSAFVMKSSDLAVCNKQSQKVA